MRLEKVGQAMQEPGATVGNFIFTLRMRKQLECPKRLENS